MFDEPTNWRFYNMAKIDKAIARLIKKKMEKTTKSCQKGKVSTYNRSGQSDSTVNSVLVMHQADQVDPQHPIWFSTLLVVMFEYRAKSNS